MTGSIKVSVVAPGVEAWASAEDGVGDAGSRGSSPTPPAAAASSVERPFPARVLLRLLRLAALTGDCRPPNLLYTLLVHSLYMAATVYLIGSSADESFRHLAAGKTIVETSAITGYMGFIFVLMWAPLTCCLVAGRRRYGEVLRKTENVGHRLMTLSTYRECREKYRKQTAYLLTAVGCWMLYVAAVSLYEAISVCESLNPDCVFTLLYSIALFLIYCVAHLVPFKFALVGLELLSGYRAIAQELRDVCQGKRRLSAAGSRTLRAIYVELSDTFSTLTDAMSMELITVMSHGTLSSVSIWMLLICSIRNGAVAVAYMAPYIILYILGATLALVLPCEMVQRVLDMVSQTRGLLLKPQLQQSQQELDLFWKAVGHDLDTLGDLGLFRIQRSTILSIMATILTYIIVMVQFLTTELSAKPTQ